MDYLVCIGYLVILAIASHFIGQALPRTWFNSESFPFCSMKWEQDGAIYERVKIRRWKDKVPDMSRFMPDMMPKRVSRQAKSDEIQRLIEETCVAEFIHWMLILAGLGCPLIWRGIGGIIVTAVWIVLGNLPFILIQRYNRPRLKKAQARLNILKGRHPVLERDCQWNEGFDTNV